MDSPRPLLPPSTYPGERLGLPETGRGSVARLGRRILALLVDGVIADLVTLAVFGGAAWGDPNGPTQWAPLVVFTVLQILGILTIGGSIGHRLLGLRVAALPGTPPRWWRPVVRSLLLAVVVPALVWDSDQRGFHDKVAGTVLIRS
ncbi:RDD family protein [Gryllotalpicola sp.]|uniref:RDD family protein n=1 Tax=Gryllotalpicola sp. TaxID=1932787 RepID=UPI00263989DC|nr:RDD family protein [Gryllotalpicola sp.]